MSQLFWITANSFYMDYSFGRKCIQWITMRVRSLNKHNGHCNQFWKHSVVTQRAAQIKWMSFGAITQNLSIWKPNALKRKWVTDKCWDKSQFQFSELVTRLRLKHNCTWGMGWPHVQLSAAKRCLLPDNWQSFELSDIYRTKIKRCIQSCWIPNGSSV